MKGIVCQQSVYELWAWNLFNHNHNDYCRDWWLWMWNKILHQSFTWSVNLSKCHHYHLMIQAPITMLSCTPLSQIQHTISAWRKSVSYASFPRSNMNLVLTCVFGGFGYELEPLFLSLVLVLGLLSMKIIDWHFKYIFWSYPVFRQYKPLVDRYMNGLYGQGAFLNTSTHALINKFDKLDNKLNLWRWYLGTLI